MSAYELIRFSSPDDLAQAAAKAWIAELEGHTKDPYRVALSGGRITQNFFSAVVKLVAARKTIFDRVHFYWADERCVPPDDKESNYRIARELLFAPLGISDAQVHRIRGEEAPQLAAQMAEGDLCHGTMQNAQAQPVFDLIFLGMGEDGHTASLFPEESEEARASKAVYRNVVGSKPPPNRVTLGFPAIAAARQVWMLASGSGKEAALRDSLNPDGKTPFGRVLKLRASTKIFTDIPV